MVIRCEWADGDPLMEKYHDEEWRIPKTADHCRNLCLIPRIPRLKPREYINFVFRVRWLFS